MAVRLDVAEVSDHLDVEIPLGGRALVVSDMHLAGPSTAASRQASRELALALENWAGPGVLVLLGDILELLLGENAGDPAPALAAHPRLTAALARFSAAWRGTRTPPAASPPRPAPPCA